MTSISTKLLQVFEKGMKSAFFKGISFLMGGTLVTQALTLLLAPILTRLYSPEDYGINSLYISTISILGVITTLRLNSAIIIAKNLHERIRLVRLCISISVLIAALTFIFISGIYYLVVSENFLWLWFVPVSVLFLGFYEVQYAAILNQNKFKVLAKVVVIKVTVQGLSQIGFYFLGFTHIGLILGNILSLCITVLVLLNWDKLRIVWDHVFNWKENWRTFKNHIEFPKFAFPAELASIASLMLFPFLISFIYSVEEVGYFALANKLIGIPIGLFGNSIRQVFAREIGPHFNNPLLLKKKYVKTGKLLFTISLICGSILYFFGPPFFSIVFGSEWKSSGFYVQSLIILLMARLTISPLLSILHVLKKQKLNLVINSWLILCMFICTTSVKYIFHVSIENFLFLISLGLGTIYLFGFFRILKILNVRNDD